MAKKKVSLRLDKGVTVKTTHDLAAALRHMPADIFKKHVSSSKNLFATWLRKIGEGDLAKKISKHKTKDPMEKTLLRELINNMQGDQRA